MAATLPNRVRRIAAAAALAFALAGCGDKGGAERPPAPGDLAVARVDGRVVWASDVKREAVAQGLIGEGEPLDVSSDLFRRVMDAVVDQKLLAAEALKLKLDKSAVAQRRLEAARERILGDMVVETVVAKAVNEGSVRDLYQEQLKLAKGSEEIRARQIVVATPEEAQAVLKLLAEGGSFEAVAMERSTDQATRFNGGDMGYFTPDVLPEAYGAALKTAKAGQLVGPFAVEGGWALVRVEDRRPEAPITMENARPQIVRYLTYDQIRVLLQKLRSQAKIEPLLPAQPAAPATRAKEPADAPRPPPSGRPVAPPPAPPAAPAAPAQEARP